MCPGHVVAPKLPERSFGAMGTILGAFRRRGRPPSQALQRKGRDNFISVSLKHRRQPFRPPDLFAAHAAQDLVSVLRRDHRHRRGSASPFFDKCLPKAELADYTIEALFVAAETPTMKCHPLFDPLHTQAPQARLPKKFVPGMKRCNLEEVVDARGWLFANEACVMAANQYGCNPLRQIAIDMLLDRGGFSHGRFHVEAANSG